MRWQQGKKTAKKRALIPAVYTKDLTPPFFAALWYHVPDSSQWVLAIATPVVSRVGPLAAYSRLQRILRGMHPSYLSLSDISLFSPASPEMERVRATVGLPKKFGMAPPNGHTQDLSPFGEAYVHPV